MRRLLALALPAALLACGDKEATTPAPTGDDTGAGVDTGDGPTRCGSAGDTLPEGLVELTYDAGSGAATVLDIDYSLDGEDLNDTTLYESVRFDLAHPARIHGIAVMWGHLPDGAPERELAASLWPDFGYNGFDAWVWAPLWEGTRCLGEVTDDDWTVYAFDAPVEVDQPGLVYAGQVRTSFDDPALWFDTQTTNADGSCGAWDDCHSALNMPEAQASSYYNGTSFPFQYNYLVRIFVEYTDAVTPEDGRFRPTATMDVDADTDGALDPVPLSSRAAWGDYDNDGWDDLFTGASLLRNNGDGTFTDTTADSGIAATGTSRSGGVWGDYDNDGDLDLMVFAETYAAGDALLRNEGDGTFVDVTAEAGIDDTQDYEDCGDPAANTHAPTPGAAWLDYDGDGFLDLYLSNFICWDSGDTYRDDVYRNNGDGTFANVSGTRGWSDRKRAGRGVNPADADGDGDVDVLVHNYRLHDNLYFDNQGDGTVVERAAEVDLDGVANMVGTVRYYGHTIGTAWGDLDNDGDLDVIESNLAHPRFYHFSDKTRVLLNDGTGSWSDIQGDWALPVGDAGLRYQETHSVPVLADFDSDGALDLAISAVYDGRPTDFYWGNGDGTFRLDSYHSGIEVQNGWGMAAGDYDNDGDADLATKGVLYENTGDGGHWLQVRALGGVRANAAGVGATVRVVAGGTTRLRVASGGNGQGGQDSLYLHFGLGEASGVDRVEVDYPGAGTVTFEGPFDVDQRLWVMEDGTTATGWAPPVPVAAR